LKQFDNLIWGGCSYSAGGGFLKSDSPGTVQWRHPKLINEFPHVETQHQAWNEIRKIVFPILLGEKLKVKNNINLARNSTGHQTHIKNIMSYVLNNKTELNFSKTIIGLQLTSFSRIELIDSNNLLSYKIGDSWIYDKKYVQVNHPRNGLVIEFLKNHYDKDWFDAKAMTEILMFKGWVESLGATSLIFDIENNLPITWEKPENEVLVNINKYGLDDDLLFPTLNSLKKEINHISWPRELDYPETFKSGNYFDDGHFTKKGHKQLSDFLYNEIIKK